LVFVILFFSFFFLVSPAGLVKREVKAYETVAGSLEYGRPFDTSGRTKAAVLKGISSYLVVTLGDDGSGANCDSYNTYIYNGTAKLPASCNYSPGRYVQLWLEGVSFEETGNYDIAGYLEPKSGQSGTTYFITGMTVQVYEEEVVTDTSWFGKIKTWSKNIYERLGIVSPSGRSIAGMRAKVDYFTRGGQRETVTGVAECTKYDEECGYYEWLPFPYDKRLWGDSLTEETPFVFMSGSEQDEVFFQATTDQREGCGGVCYVEHEIGAVDNIVLYTRSPGGTPTPPPPPEGCSVFGYVKDERGED